MYITKFLSWVIIKILIRFLYTFSFFFTYSISDTYFCKNQCNTLRYCTCMSRIHVRNILLIICYFQSSATLIYSSNQKQSNPESGSTVYASGWKEYSWTSKNREYNRTLSKLNNQLQFRAGIIIENPFSSDVTIIGNPALCSRVKQ